MTLGELLAELGIPLTDGEALCRRAGVRAPRRIASTQLDAETEQLLRAAAHTWTTPAPHRSRFPEPDRAGKALAIASFVIGATCWWVPIVGPLGAIGLAIAATLIIRRDGMGADGLGFATAGLWLGIVGFFVGPGVAAVLFDLRSP